MRRRRHHRDSWSMPSGLAEVELFTFWEADLAADLPPDLPPDLAVVQPVEDRAPVDRPPRGADDAPSTAPLCWALGSVLAFLLVALLL